LTESGDARDAAELLIERRVATEPETVEVQYHKLEDGQPVRDPDTGHFVPSPDNTDISPEQAADDLQAWRDSQTSLLHEQAKLEAQQAVDQLRQPHKVYEETAGQPSETLEQWQERIAAEQPA
jgi:hypothetical protein